MHTGRVLLCGLMLVMLCLAGCGGGGSSVTQTTTPTVQNTMTVKLSTSGTFLIPPSLAGVGITLTLPSGVTVRTDGSGAVLPSVVKASGVAVPGTAISVYTPATATKPGTLNIVVASSATAGFGTGEFATVTFDLASGSNPTLGDFGVSGFRGFDLSGNTMPGLTPALL